MYVCTCFRLGLRNRKSHKTNYCRVGKSEKFLSNKEKFDFYRSAYVLVLQLKLNLNAVNISFPAEWNLIISQNENRFHVTFSIIKERKRRENCLANENALLMLSGRVRRLLRKRIEIKFFFIFHY